ncbi:DUF7619 domain-containing protein [Aureispira anguillae]|uniref:T9SS type A sorting domain-containing protein n=1 Tax=Aureispira anguillae TaxID=2864201 RepID=A0A916DR03_9BACT|nr:T9SS type A sorting domain-containing protein [Aureispira anguillae]BDS10047.1 T9SS type A sorting domain-containing protein [Aureispira anguillae]
MNFNNYYTSKTSEIGKSKTIILWLGILFLLLGNIANGQVALEWAKSMKGTTHGVVNAMTTDKWGNVYTTGYFYGTVDFDPNTGVDSLTAVGGYDIFIQKLDAKGNLLWAKSMGGSYNDEAHSIVVDDFGNVYTIGQYYWTVDFNPNAGINPLTALGSSDIFIQKLDANGNFVWAKSIGSTDQDAGYGISMDHLGNIYTTGWFRATVDFDPNIGVNNLTAVDHEDVFVQKLDANGNFIWAKSMGGVSGDEGRSLAIDDLGNVYTTGRFRDTVDFDPGVGVYKLVSTSLYDLFIQKLDANGNFVWAKSIDADMGRAITVDHLNDIYITGSFSGTVDFNPNGGGSTLTAANTDVFVWKLGQNGNFIWAKGFGGAFLDIGYSIATDRFNNVYTMGRFSGPADLNPNAGVQLGSSSGSIDIFIQKLDANGNFIWAKSVGGPNYDSQTNGAITVDHSNNVYTAGNFVRTADFSFHTGRVKLKALNSDLFVQKLKQKGIVGRIYHDFSQDCVQDTNEVNLPNRMLILNPGNIITSSNANGIWAFDSLPIGNYSITVDTTGEWRPTCPITQHFSVVSFDSLVEGPSFGFVPRVVCPKPNVTIHAPFLRPGFSNQRIYVQAENQSHGTGSLDSAYVIIELDSLLTVQSANLPYTNLGNNQYSVYLDTLFPSSVVNFWLDCQLSNRAILGQTLCLQAALYPIKDCALDTFPTLFPPRTIPCSSIYDQSHLDIDAFCQNDSIHFMIVNKGSGNMSCFSPIRLYIDSIYTLTDSVLLNSGDTAIFAYSGDGRTWRMEVDQHPLHLGNSKPSATIELCGNRQNWTPNLVTVFPQDDADPQIDIYCGIVAGSFDSNNKQGFPLGVGTAHDILPNQEMEYFIRFQNTGTDTVFTIVIRDTLSMDLDINSVRPSVASDNYSFRIYGPRVLEWTFNNIRLPDSTTNSVGSHGFVAFKVNQIANLSLGTIIENTATIYFDANPPIFTNATAHQIAGPQDLNWEGEQTLDVAACESYRYNNKLYTKSGTYWQAINNGGRDSLYTINLSILNSTALLTENACGWYMAPDSQIYTNSGQYTALIPNAAGCDSIITIHLTIKDSTFATIYETSCDSFIAPDSQVYANSGQYTAIIQNAAGCDSIITIHLTIKNSTFATIYETSCDSFIAPDSQVYTSSGQYTAIIPNAAGCDSVITIYLTIPQVPTLTLNDTACGNFYIAPDGQFLFTSGQYTFLMPSYQGCDSTVIINLVFSQHSSVSINEYACSSYIAPDGQAYFSSGQYTATIPNSSGCDSTITINLTIDSLVDSSVHQNGFTLSANAVGYTYQWLDCNNGNASISGATNAFYTATANGIYAVQITNGTCTVTSNCINVTGLLFPMLEKNMGIQVYPNPTTALLYLSKKDKDEIRISLIDNLGRVLVTRTSTALLTTINMNDLPSGIYHLSINNGQESITQKIVKQ